MEEEVRYLIALLEDRKLLEYAGFCFHLEKLYKIHVIILQCSIGKVTQP